MPRRKTDSGNPTPRRMRVLVVDDDEHFRVYMRSLVRRLGCSVETAADGMEALAMLSQGTFDLLLSDREMPKLDGLDLIDHVRTHAEAANIYAVMITAHEDVQSKVDALTRGFDDFMPKSCTEAEVTARVIAARRVLSRQQLLDADVRRWQMLASRDELTNVATRRFFVERANEHLRERLSIAVALFDLDDFKRVNDTYGHLTGDRILHDIGGLFLSKLRRDDVIARYGGDEFVLLLPGGSLEDATVVVERLLVNIAEMNWLVGTETVTVTASAGVAHSSLLETADLDHLIEAADHDLYARKYLKANPVAPPDEVYLYPRQETDAPVIEIAKPPPEESAQSPTQKREKL